MVSTIRFNNTYIKDYYTVLGSTDNNPVIKNKVDKVFDNYYYDNKSLEETESYYRKMSVDGVLEKSRLENVDLMLGSDLQNQLLASHLNASKYPYSFLGVFGACSSFGLGLIVASSFIQNKLENVLLTVSSHNLVNEKQFRFPIEYGAMRKKVNSYSMTGSVSTIVSNEGSIKIECATIGRVVDSKMKDANDMGNAMALSAIDTLDKHLHDTNRSADYYDLILTGDLGQYALKNIKEYYSNKNVYIDNIKDSGYELFAHNKKFRFAGGSGPVCLPMILYNNIDFKKYKKILIIATGCLHSSTSCNLKLNIPVVSHAVSLEIML